MNKQYRVREAMSGTADYGWYVEALGTDGKWYNWFGTCPLANGIQIQRAASRLEAMGFERTGTED